MNVSSAVTLNEAGYSVGYAEDGAAGFQMLFEGSWDAVTADRSMPHMSEEQLAKEVKAISPKTPIILISGYIMKDSNLGLFDAVLQKPFSMSDLKDSVAMAIERAA